MKQFGDVTVLDGLNMSIAAGERVTLIGPSGSGKTTILRLLMTLERPSAGVIYVDGEPLWHMRQRNELVPASEAHLRRMRRDIGMVFQQFNLFPNMSIIRNMVEGPIHALGLSPDVARDRALSLLDLVGLKDRADARPSQLSGGQQQRVAIARALAMEPKVLLLDEVTSALDPELVAGVLSVLRDLAASTDITMLIVTHEMGFARDVSDRVMMFDSGNVIEHGPPSQVLADPTHPRTRQFLRALLER